MSPVPSGTPFPPVPGTPPDFDFDTWQQFQSFCRQRLASGSPAPQYEEFIAWRQFSDALAQKNASQNVPNTSPNAPQPGPGTLFDAPSPFNVPAGMPLTVGGIPIDPMLVLQSLSQRVDRIDHNGKGKTKRKRTCEEDYTDNEADDESNDDDGSSSGEDNDGEADTTKKSLGRASCRRRSSKNKPKIVNINNDPGTRILTSPGKKLSPRERDVRKQLKDMTTSTIHEVTSLKRNPIVVPRVGEQAPPTPRPKAGDKALPVAWGERIDHPQNKVIIQQVATLIMEQEENPKRATISRKNRKVKFGRGDIEYFAKCVLQHWNARYRAKKEVVLLKKLNTARVNGKRRARQRSTVQRRANTRVVEAFLDQNPRMEWVVELLVTDFMSLEVSTPGEDSENTREEWFTRVQQAGGLTEEQIARGVKVLEKVSIGWRAKKLNNIFHRLDAIADELLRSSGVKLTRVDFGRKTKGPPTCSVFPCMISKTWLAKNEKTPMPAADEDPEGVDEIWDADDLSD